MSTNTPDVSVLVTSKNNPDKLEKLLESVRSQTCSSMEIILVDDGSSPPHQGFCVDRLIRHESSVGYIRSRNELARLARGRYLLFVDDDVVLPGSEFIANSIKIFESNSDCGVMAFGQVIPELGDRCLQPSFSTQRCYVSTYFGWTHLFRAEVWRNSGGVCELFDYGYEETEHSIRLLDSGIRIMYDPSLKVIHNCVSASKSPHLRRNQIHRNAFFAGIMLSRWVTLHRTILSSMLCIYRENRAAGMSRLQSLSWCFWAVGGVFSRLKGLVRLHKPVSHETFRLSSRLNKAPFHAPPNYPI
jgi:GT2 family glycosyltransferase